MNPEFLRRIGIRPLDRTLHDRAAFASGVDRIDNYLRNNAARNADADHDRVYVACLDGDTRVLGYYVICPHAVDVSSLPEDVQARMPRRPRIAAFYLSIIATDITVQRQGLGSFLLADAFRRCVKAADIAGGHFLVLDALNEPAARLYRRLGFVDMPTPGQESRMIIGMAKLRAAVRAAEG